MADYGIGALNPEWKDFLDRLLYKGFWQEDASAEPATSLAQDALTATIPNARKQLPSADFAGDPQQIIADINAIPDPRERKAALDAYARSLGGHLPPAPSAAPAGNTLADLAKLISGIGGQQGAAMRSSMPSTDFSLAEKYLKDAEAKAGNAKFTMPDYVPLVERAKEFSSLSKKRPDVESDDYTPLQGKRLADFMFNLGTNLLAQRGMPLSAAIGESIKGAKSQAEGQAANKYKMDTEKWRDLMADAKIMMDLGQKDYEALTDREKLKYSQARQGVADSMALGKNYLDIAGKKSEDAYRKAHNDAQMVAAGGRSGVKDKLQQALQAAQFFKGLDPKMSDTDAFNKGMTWAIGKQEKTDKPQDMTKAVTFVGEQFPGIMSRPGGALAAQTLAEHYAGTNPLSPGQLETFLDGLRKKGIIK